MLRPPSFDRHLRESLSGSERSVHLRVDDGESYLEEQDVSFGEVERTVYSIRHGDPESAAAEVEHDLDMVLDAKTGNGKGGEP